MSWGLISAGWAKEAFSAGLDQLARALKNFSDSRKGKRKGRRVGFPRFKKRGKARDSFWYTTGAYGPADDRHVKLPWIGRVKVHEPMGTLTDRLADGRARLLGATVSRTAGLWFVSFTVEVELAVPAGPTRRQRTGGTVGVDLGVTHLAVLSTGETVDNPKHLAGSLRRLRTASRAYARSKPGSAGRRRHAARIARIHGRIARIHGCCSLARGSGPAPPRRSRLCSPTFCGAGAWNIPWCPSCGSSLPAPALTRR